MTRLVPSEPALVIPWRIGDIVAAALAILHPDHGRTT